MGTRIDGGKHTYQTLGDLFIEFEGLGNVSNYKRSLDLNTAVAKTEFEAEGFSHEVVQKVYSTQSSLRFSPRMQNRNSWLGFVAE